MISRMINLSVLRAITAAGASGAVVMAAIEAMVADESPRSAGGPAVAVAQHSPPCPAATATVGVVPDIVPDTGPAMRPAFDSRAYERARKARQRAAKSMSSAAVIARPVCPGHVPDTPSFFSSVVINRTLEEKKERSGVRDKRVAVPLPHDWEPKDRHFKESEAFGFADPRTKVLDMAAIMTNWARAEEHRPVARKSNWDAFFSTWLRREAEKRHQCEMRLPRQAMAEPIGERILIKAETPQWRAWQLHLRETRGRETPINKQSGWYFPSEWPPEMRHEKGDHRNGRETTATGANPSKAG